MVRIRLRGLAFMRWVVVTLVENRKIASLTPTLDQQRAGIDRKLCDGPLRIPIVDDLGLAV